jgi:hypothetical protein
MSAPDDRDVPNAVAKPRSVRIVRDGEEETLSFRWARPAHLGLIVFAIVAGVFFTALFSAARQSMDWGMLAATIFAGVTEAALIWAMLAGLINRTYVTISPQALWVHHGPIPIAHRGRSYARDELRQLYVEKYESRENRPDHYRLMAETKAGEHFTLTNTMLSTRDSAMSYIAWRVNQWLIEIT